MGAVKWDMRAKKMHKFLALMPGVQDTLGDYATERYEVARAIHGAHRDRGHSEIYLASPENENGTSVDWHVGLSDERGSGSAAAIEYKLFILHRAFGGGSARRFTSAKTRKRRRAT